MYSNTCLMQPTFEEQSIFEFWISRQTSLIQGKDGRLCGPGKLSPQLLLLFYTPLFPCIQWEMCFQTRYAPSSHQQSFSPSLPLQGRVCGQGDLSSRPFLLIFDLTECLNPATLLAGCPTPQVIMLMMKMFMVIMIMIRDPPTLFFSWIKVNI